MSDELESAELFNTDGIVRMRRFVIACLGFGIVLAGATALVVHAIAPEGGWNVALGIGAMVGFWMAPLGGALIGNGMHEIIKERAGGGSAH